MQASDHHPSLERHDRRSCRNIAPRIVKTAETPAKYSAFVILLGFVRPATQTNLLLGRSHFVVGGHFCTAGQSILLRWDSQLSCARGVSQLSLSRPVPHDFLTVLVSFEFPNYITKLSNVGRI